MELSTAFRSVGAQIDRDWRAVCRNERDFPQIAQRALSALQPLRLTDLVPAILSDALPVQASPSADFGQPPVTVYRGEGFYIEVLFWIDALLSVHQHRFSGAFKVLQGSSIHTRYTFESQRRLSAALLLGTLSLDHAELLTEGEVRRIEAGPALIHATYHLERPSITAVVRTFNELEMGPPYDYRQPGLALDPSLDRPQLRRRLLVLKMMARAQPEDYVPLACEWLQREDAVGAYWIMDQVWEITPFEKARARIAEAARAAHGDVVERFVASLDGLLHLRETAQLRGRTEDPELSFFIAALCTVPRRDALLSVVRARFENADPVDKVLQWLLRFESELRFAIMDTSTQTIEAVRARLEGRVLDEAQARVIERLRRRRLLDVLLHD